jgi:hypothetical protein
MRVRQAQRKGGGMLLRHVFPRIACVSAQTIDL